MPEPAAPRGEGPTLAALRRLGRWLMRLPRSLAWLLPLVWMLVLWWLSSRPARPGSGVTGRITFLGNLAHAPAFGLLAFAWLLLVPRGRGWIRLGWPALAAVFTASLAYGVVDELHQRHVPGRDCSLLDLMTNAVGIANVLWIAAYVGSPGASERGLRARLALGLLLCLLAAGTSTGWSALVRG